MSSPDQPEAPPAKDNQAGEWIGGVHAVLEVLRERPGEALEVWFARRRQDRLGEAILAAARRGGVKVVTRSRTEIDGVLPGLRHQGVALRQSALRYTPLAELLGADPSPRLVVALDGVEDPRNLGAILRTAWAFRVDGILVPKHRAAGLTPVAAKTAAGAAGEVPVSRVVNLVEALEQLKRAGFWIYGAAGDGARTLAEMDFTGPIVLVLGAEGKGLRPGVRAACDQLFRIPMEGAAGSLNVAVAAGIILHRAYLMRNRP